MGKIVAEARELVLRKYPQAHCWFNSVRDHVNGFGIYPFAASFSPMAAAPTEKAAWIKAAQSLDGEDRQ